MRIKKITVSGYRSFDFNGQTVKFEDIKKPFSIIGHNNCGKTNFLQSLLISTGTHDEFWRKKDYDFHNKETDKAMNMSVKFSEPFPISTIYPGEKADKECWGAEYSCQFLNGRSDAFLRCTAEDGSVIVKQEKMKSRSLPVSFNTQKKPLNVIYINFHDLDKHVSLSGRGLLSELFRDIKEDFYSPDNKIKLQDGTEQVRSNVFETLAEKLKSVLYTDMLKDFLATLNDEMSSTLKLSKEMINFDFIFSSPRDLYNRANLEVVDSEGKVALPIASLGSGLKAMVVVAMLKVLSERDDEEKIFILEEPETFLHELYQDYLYEILCKLSEKHQVIYTTHSKKFVDIFEPKSIIKVHNPKHLKSEIIQVKDDLEVPEEAYKELSLNSVDDFSYFMKTLEPNLGLILFSRKVLLVEGPHDVLAYKMAFGSTILSAKNIAIVAVWGKTTSQYVCALTKHFKVDRFLVHDWDLSDLTADIDLAADDTGSIYSGLSTTDRKHYSNNHNISKAAEGNIHWNKINLEAVLDIGRKGTIEIAAKLTGKSIEDIEKDYPNFLSNPLIKFMEAQPEPPAK